YDYTLEKGFAFAMMGGDTPDPDRLMERVEQEIPKFVENGLTEEEFQRIKKKKIGASLRLLNSLEWIANQFTQYRFLNTDLFRIIPLLEFITFEDVQQRIQELFDMERMAVSVVTSKTK